MTSQGTILFEDVDGRVPENKVTLNLMQTISL